MLTSRGAAVGEAEIASRSDLDEHMGLGTATGPCIGGHAGGLEADGGGAAAPVKDFNSDPKTAMPVSATEPTGEVTT